MKPTIPTPEQTAAQIEEAKPDNVDATIKVTINSRFKIEAEGEIRVTKVDGDGRKSTLIVKKEYTDKA